MQLYDKDLLSVQEVRELVEKAKKAQKSLSEKTQDEVDEIVKSIALAGVRNARRLAEMAHDETGFGNAEDKTVKNIFGSRGVYEAIRDMKTIGEIDWDEEKQVRSIAVPVGVIAGIIPSTNPTSTTLYKAEIAVKAGNAIVFSPHPMALHCILETVKVIRQAVAEAGGDENLVSCISIPTMQSSESLMKHADISLILATGGSSMVRAAYSSGTPAIGVGPGNGPAYIEPSADLTAAVKRIMDSKTFDNGTICASEQSVICNSSMVAQVRAEFEKQGAYFLNQDEQKQLGNFILRPDGTMNPLIVGKSVKEIGELAQLNLPEKCRVLIATEDGIGRGHPYSNEKLAPILAFYSAANYEKVCELCMEILHYEGAGHTFMIHTKSEEMVRYFSRRIPASRILVNTAGALGGIGAGTGLLPSLTLGCGAIGGSATSENVGPMNLLDIRRVAYGLLETEVIRENADTGDTGICAGKDISKINIDEIVQQIIKRIQNT